MPPWMCAWRLPLQRLPAEMLHRRHSTVNCRIAEMKSPHPAVTRTLQYAADIASSRNGQQMRNRFIAGGNTKPRSLPCAEGQPGLAQFRILQRGQSGSSQASSTDLCTSGDMSPLSTTGQATTTSTTLRLTQEYLTTTMTLSPW